MIFFGFLVPLLVIFPCVPSDGVVSRVENIGAIVGEHVLSDRRSIEVARLHS